MTSLRMTAQRLLRVTRNTACVTQRSLHRGARAAVPWSRVRPLLVGGAALTGAYAVHLAYKNGVTRAPRLATVHAAVKPPASQPTVYSATKDHALFLTIHLKSTADVKACARVAAKIQKYVNDVCPPELADEDDEVWAGVGFGPKVLEKVLGKPKKNYTYVNRRGALGAMPATGGDIFIHAKSNDVSKLFELCQTVMDELPEGSVDRFEDIYSFVFKNGRDLTGFIDGTENAADEEDRQKIAVEKQTGGSYVVAQKWVHRLDVIGRESVSTKEGWVGRTLDDSTELRQKSITSHVARMTGGKEFDRKKAFEIVRQSMPYGTVSREAGLFFIGYSESPENLNFMLDRMVGTGSDKHSDDIMRMTECVASTYWYFPGAAELAKLA